MQRWVLSEAWESSDGTMVTKFFKIMQVVGTYGRRLNDIRTHTRSLFKPYTNTYTEAYTHANLRGLNRCNTIVHTNVYQAFTTFVWV